MGLLRTCSALRVGARVRAMLYSCVRNAVQYNPPIRAFYHWLRERGKHHMVAMTACTPWVAVHLCTDASGQARTF